MHRIVLYLLFWTKFTYYSLETKKIYIILHFAKSCQHPEAFLLNETLTNKIIGKHTYFP